MPALLPAPNPRFSCSITRAAGNRSRTSSSVPSVEPLSTTITSFPCTDCRQGSIQGSALYVTTTTETSSRIGNGRSSRTLPDDDQEPGQRKRERHQEEDEAGREGGIGVNAELAEEVDEECLAHGEAIDGERHEHDEEEQRPENDERADREMDPDRLRRCPDRDDARELGEGGDHRDDRESRDVVAVAVDPLVGGPDRLVDADAPEERDRPGKRPPGAP